MESLYAVDRFEGVIAVVVGDDGVQFEVRRDLLPVGTQEGSVLRVLVKNGVPFWNEAVLDESERLRRDAEGRNRLDRLQRRDPGGDIEL